MSAAVWYWREGAEQKGPVAWEELQALAEKGTIAPNDWVTREGWIEWKLACEASEVEADKEDAALDKDLEPAAGDALPPLPPPVPLPVNIAAQPVVVMPAAPDGIATAEAAAPAIVPEMAPVTVPIGLTPAAPDAMYSVAGPAIPLPMPAPVELLPTLDPGETLAAEPAADDAAASVQDLRRALRDPRGFDAAPGKRQYNFLAVGALAAAVLGLLVLAFELGLVAVGLGGYCLYAASVSGSDNGKSLAAAAVGIGAFNVAFRIVCASVDLGLTHL